MPTIVAKGPQTLMSSTMAYGMTIQGTNSRTSTPPFPFFSDVLEILQLTCLVYDLISRLEKLIADWTIPLDDIHQMSLIRIKCWTGLIK